jgi:signal transduction histidine kinase
MIHNTIGNSSKTGLEKTKARLSAIFTLVVFVLTLILISIFLTYKYNTTLRSEKSQFSIISNEIANWMSNTENFLEKFNESRNRFIASSSGRKWPPEIRNLLYMNFLVLNSESNEIVFANINRNFDAEQLAGTELKNGFFIKDSVMVRVVPLNNFSETLSLVVFREMGYSKDEYITDLIKSIILAILSSIVFYIIWRKFVWHTLKPIEENIHDMQDFIHNAGHELKTPLAVVHGNLQFLKATKAYDPEIHNESIEEIDKLNKLIESLVDLSNIQDTHAVENKCLKNEIENAIKDFSSKADKKNIKIMFHHTANPYAKVHPEYFYILFSNILWNAIKYSEKKWKIHVTLNQKSFEIQDFWIGIPKEKQEKIFERFFKAHNRNTEGYGIWLSLVRKIINLYKWNIKVKSDEGEGTTVKVIFK